MGHYFPDIISGILFLGYNFWDTIYGILFLRYYFWASFMVYYFFAIISGMLFLGHYSWNTISEILFLGHYLWDTISPVGMQHYLLCISSVFQYIHVYSAGRRPTASRGRPSLFQRLPCPARPPPKRTFSHRHSIQTDEEERPNP